MSKLSDTLKNQGISTRQLTAASRLLERLGPEDRVIRLAKARVRGGTATDAEKETAGKKPRSGKPVSAPTLEKALRGDRVSGSTKTRIVRAVNRILQQKKKSELQLKDLF
jgi:hypothetical protein